MRRVVEEADLREACELLFRRVQAAHELWRGGHLAESLVLTNQGLERVESVAMSGEFPASWEPELRALREEYSSLAEGAERNFGPAHALWLDRARALAGAIKASVQAGPRRRRQRWLALALAASLGLAVVMAVRVRASPRPTVSASYGSDFKGRYAIDGVEATEWLLPDGATGWLELDFSGGKQLREVRLLNARNRHYLDRGTKRAKLVTSRAGEAVETLEVELPGPTEKSRERRVKLRGMQVDKLRIEVLSHHGLGAGLAEVSYD